MHHLGILAYGSLTSDAGEELEKATVRRISGVQTPFYVEFARSSSSRGGAPTLVPVERGGAKVAANILVLGDDVSAKAASDMLWRRETNQVGGDAPYRRPTNPCEDSVLVECLGRFHGIEAILYAKIAPTMKNPTPDKLAELAIRSAKGPAGLDRRDGISYLLIVRRSGIQTPLMDEYERVILRQTATSSLEEAWSKCRRRVNP